MLFSLALIPVALTRTVEPKLADTPRTKLKELFLISPLSVIAALAAGLVTSAFWAMGAVFAHNIGLSVADISAFMSTVIFGGALLLWPVGQLSDRWDRRDVLIVVSFTGAIAALGIFMSVGNLPIVLLFAFLYGGVSFAIYALAVAHLNDHLKAGEVLEATRGILLVYGIGAALGPMVSGLCMVTWGDRTLLGYFAAILALLGLFGMYRTQRSTPIPAEEQGEFIPMVHTTQAALEMHPEADLEPGLDLEPPIDPSVESPV